VTVYDLFREDTVLGCRASETLQISGNQWAEVSADVGCPSWGFSLTDSAGGGRCDMPRPKTGARIEFFGFYI
jgi:hypothetical protein